MAQDLDDLLPLFLSEARDRLERLVEVAERVEDEEDAARSARRELHALKGASRMMRLMEFSELCHQAEGFLDPPRPGAALRLVELLDRLVALLGGLGVEAASPSPEAEAMAARSEAPGAGGDPAAAREMRVPTRVLDVLSDGATQVRILASSDEEMLSRLLELASVARHGVASEDPHQVLASLAPALRHVALELEGRQRRLHYLVEHQLDALLRLQVQPLRPFLLTLARHARDLARSLGRDLEVTVETADSQLDRRLMGALEEAFLHLVRNAVDHGIEPAAAREAAGKPGAGQLRLDATAAGDRVHLRVVDDGAGIEPERVLAAARRQGLVSAEEAERMGPGEVLQILFRPGFSTREEATQVSGRGVGLDAVASAVRQVGGDVWLSSIPGRGTTVELEVPMARRGERVLVLRSGVVRVALPAGLAVAFRRPTSDTVLEEDGRRMARLGDRLLPVHSLGALVGEGRDRDRLLMEVRVSGATVVLGVEAVEGEEEVLLRPLPAFAGISSLFEAMALLPSGRVVPVLAPHLIGQTTPGPACAASRRSAVRSLHVLLVDDSLVTREMLRWLLEEGGFEVTGVGSAEEALRLLSDHDYDCLVTDIEMPGMNGLELIRRLRTTPQRAQLPVVAVSTRERSEDRLAGLEAGADAYITKQTLNAAELNGLVRRLGGGRA